MIDGVGVRVGTVLGALVGLSVRVGTVLGALVGLGVRVGFVDPLLEESVWPVPVFMGNSLILPSTVRYSRDTQPITFSETIHPQL